MVVALNQYQTVPGTIYNSMRFHLIGLAHIPTSAEYQNCAYTQKVVKLARILKMLDHTVYFYGTEGSNVPCDRITISGLKSERLAVYGDYDWRRQQFKQDPNDSVHRRFNARAAASILTDVDRRDFLLCPLGSYQRPIADSVEMPLTVETGIGYTGCFAPFRVWESATWMHHVYGLMKQEDGSWYDEVIANYWDPEDFDADPAAPVSFEQIQSDGTTKPVEIPKEFYLYVGRLIKRKGLRIAVETTDRLGVPLVVAGQGSMLDVEGDKYEHQHVIHVGSIGVKQRAWLMNHAKAVIMPTLYIEPFGGVHIEANMCGTPVVTSDWGVFVETVRNGFNGYRCRTFDEFIRALKLAPGLDRDKIRQDARSKYNLTVAAERYQDFFERIQNLGMQGGYQNRGGWYAETNRDTYRVK